ncbi:DUF397 domain-containing protein [Streptomyces sp. ISL-43]|uniref:DUF397 domain-containing protein n=1 Tax=Streptomyces sp. ISL-43 TaxID=2819183 RepID=UPI001BE92B02|nr:DUF397 domain-containing protein [Streptomyces sp. ISL-43]MBT2449364.1 DUF397 domain-containing protein [Streptomyces sp. ISL-43]
MNLSTHARWRKSSYSNGTGGECVEVADGDGCIGVRDSKQHQGPFLSFESHAWSIFVEQVRRGS